MCPGSFESHRRLTTSETTPSWHVEQELPLRMLQAKLLQLRLLLLPGWTRPPLQLHHPLLKCVQPPLHHRSRNRTQTSLTCSSWTR